MFDQFKDLSLSKNGWLYIATAPAPDGTFNSAGAKSVTITAIDWHHAQCLADALGLRLDGIIINPHKTK